MLKSILEICLLITASVLVSCLCSVMLWQRFDLKLFCLLLVQYLFVCMGSLYVFIYLKAVAARALHVDASEIQMYNSWIFGCLVIMCIQMSSLTIAKL
jgi:hypothetical protein